MGINVFYFDSESAVDPTFWVKAGCEVDDMLYIQASSVEQVMEFIEEILGVSERSLFIWDSLAMTPCNSDIEGDFNPNSSMAVKARLLSKAFQKLTVPLANANSAFLVLNQLKTNIPQGPNARIEIMTTPYVTPGGKALNYSASLRIWLTGRKAKASFVYDDTKEVIGSEVKATLQKSRFGTLKRTSIFKILWGNKVGIQDEESWLEAIKGSDRLQNAGSWYTIKTDEGKEFKFQPSKWDSMIKENDEFRAYILKIMDEELINKFDKRGEKT
jgi:RecA/RadA recombinase